MSEQAALLNNKERRGMLRRLYCLLWWSDTLPTRFGLALTACLLAIASWVSGDQCQYIGCLYLEALAPWQWWAVGWTAYGILKMWRVLDGSPRPRVAIVVNLLGAFLFTTTAVVLTLARWPHFGISAATVSLAIAAVWVLIRTDINAGRGFWGD